MLSSLYYTILYQPLLNLLVWFYNVIPGYDVGLAIIAITLLLRILLHPLNRKSLQQQKVMRELQPKLEELKSRYKNDRQKLGLETMALYRQQKVNPFASCLPLLIQLPILIAAYNVFRIGVTNGSLDGLYSFVRDPGTIDTISLGLIDWSKSRTVPGLALALVSAVLQFFQMKMMVHKKLPQLPSGEAPTSAKDENIMTEMNKQMLYLMPAMTVIIGYSVPSGLVLYWFVTTLLSFWQQSRMMKERPLEK